MEAEPQKNGKTINWCTVDVGDANGTGEPQGIVCGAHNFARRRPGRRRAARRRAARRLRDLRAQDLRPRLRRDDLLGQRARPRRRPRRASSCCPPTRASPATTSSTLLHLRDEVIEFEINPDRAYALSLRGVAREAALALRRRPFHDPADRETSRQPNDDGYPVVVDDPDGLPGLRRPHGHRLRPGRADARPGWRGGCSSAGHAPDLAGRRRHQLRDARARPADPRLRRRQAVRPDPGPPGRPRASSSPPSTAYDRDALARGPASITDDSGPIGLGRRHGRRDHRDVRDHHATS